MNTRIFIIFILCLAVVINIPFGVSAETFATKLRGRILLQVQENGEAWYVHPQQQTRYFLNRPADAFAIMRSLGLGITNINLDQIPAALEHTIDIDTDGDGLADAFEDALGLNKTSSDTDGDGFLDAEELRNGYNPQGPNRLIYNDQFTRTHAGKIFLQVQRNGEAWYVNPVDNKRYFLGRPHDAFTVMRSLGLGITNRDLLTIPVAPTSQNIKEPSRSNDAQVTRKEFEGIVYESKTIVTSSGEFEVLITKIPQDSYRMVTLTGQDNDCFNNCQAKPLEAYVRQVGGVVGIHGSYFCPPDYVACANETYSYVSPVYNSVSGVMINEYKMSFHEGPIVIYDSLGRYRLFHRPLEIGWTIDEYQEKFGATVQSAISNYPSILENGVRVLESEPTLSAPLRDNKSPRGVLGWDDSYIYMLIAKRATLPDVATIAQQLGMSNAINLDGGGTTAMYVDGEYVIGPGRLLPNAIVFVKK